MKKYIATITRVESWHKSYMISKDNESKERFIERVENCYIKPYAKPYYKVEIFEIKDRVFSTFN